MPNVLCIDPVRALVKRAGDKIADQAIAARFRRLALNRLLNDHRCFRLASPGELADAPDWARKAAARGGEIHVYRHNRGLAARIHTVARGLADTCTVAATAPAEHPDDAVRINEAQEFLAKFGRVSFDVAARKARAFSRVLSAWEEATDALQVCDARTLVLLGGRTWRRVTSVKELRAIGREFANCLAQAHRSGGYGGMLTHGTAQFWVLRDATGKGLIVAMATAPAATHFVEVKGPRNAHVRVDHPDLMRLAFVIGMDPPTPPTQPASSATPAGLISLLDRFEWPYPDPIDRRYALVRLRRRAGAH